VHGILGLPCAVSNLLSLSITQIASSNAFVFLGEIEM
jgi:hypothetical protein